jgi:glycosyltransferase involved in cell wall biosynthesis
VPRVSVIVSHYDRRTLLPGALDSIAAQSYRDFEIVVVNDAGPDAAALVGDWAGRHHGVPTRYVHRRANGGVAATRNSGVAAGGGELLAWLDDDDLWWPGHLAGLVGRLDTRPPAALAYGDAEVVRLERLGRLEPAPARADAGAGAAAAPGWRVAGRLPLAVPFDPADLARDDFIVPGAMVAKRALCDRVGKFDESLVVSDDWDWLLRVLAAEGPAAFVRLPEIVITVRIFGAGENLSADFGARRQAALAEIERRHGTPPLAPKTFWEVAETYARRSG